MSSSLQREGPSRTTCGILALLLGGFAIHKFMMGFTSTALIQIAVIWCTCGVAGIISFIEGIMYLTMTDEDFYQKYVVEKKQWF